ncbi:MAG: NYN domain-containing protein [Bacilli bacterium]
MEEIIIVDGYNMIGDWPVFKQATRNDLAAHRELLIEYVAEYSAFSGRRAIIVFDAHLTKTSEKKVYSKRVEVIYTKENETADERIERLVRELEQVRRKIYVATSDLTEQFTIFSQGALRVSARELFNEIRQTENEIRASVDENTRSSRINRPRMSLETQLKLEKWRRGEF